MPIRVQEGDRRILGSPVEVEKREQGYYDRLFTEGLDHAGAFLQFLLRHDITAFNAQPAPPMTSSKQALIASSAPACEQEIKAMIDAGTLDFRA